MLCKGNRSSLAKASPPACEICEVGEFSGLLDFTTARRIFRTLAYLLLSFEIEAAMNPPKTAVCLTTMLILSSAAFAGEAPKAAERVIQVQIQSEPLRVSANAKKPGPATHANSRMSATVAHVGADGKLTLKCENHPLDWPAQQLPVQPR